MANDIGGWLWLFIDVILLAILGAALVYAVVMWSRRRTDSATRAASDAATERVYREAEQQDRRELPS
jgi:hypothetical protein